MRVVWESSAGAKHGLGCGPGASRDRVGNGPGAEVGAEKRNQGGMVGAKSGSRSQDSKNLAIPMILQIA